MPIRVECPSCQRTLEAPDEYAGKLAKCLKCGAAIQLPQIDIPTFIPQPVAPQQSRPESNAPQKAFDLISKMPWKTIGIAAIVLAFLLTLRTPPGPLVAVHYVALLLLGYLGTWLAIQKWLPSWRYTGKATAVSVLAAIACAWFWGQYDYSMNFWTKARDGYKSNYLDYTYRGASQPFYRHYWSDKDGHTYGAEGAFSESGKQHGKWRIEDTSLPIKDWFYDQWFWYGEEVSEGEWHLRSDKR